MTRRFIAKLKGFSTVEKKERDKQDSSKENFQILKSERPKHFWNFESLLDVPSC